MTQPKKRRPASAPVVAVAIGDPSRASEWRDALRRAAPTFDIRAPDEVDDPDSVDFAVAWRTPAGVFARYPRLQAVLSLGAGVDALLRDPELPRDVPVIRMVDAALTQGMREYVLLHVLRHHRLAPVLEEAQRERRWAPPRAPLAAERRVGVMGLGVLGRDAARHLARIGFDVRGWSRTPKRVPGIATFHGAAGLLPFAQETEILVCLMPLTSETEGLLDRRLFAAMPRGSALINAGRGEHVVDADLLAALDAGQLAGATLDAFRTEPLPPDHPFWRHPRITVTPHVASLTRADSGARHMVREMRRILAGKPPLHAADRSAGY